ncbi:hypothetical protein [uncultured Fibrobacter sp.]|uniref:hypothetical protein n=2 Tax=Fibrobacter TaxID=832 RepID=UPI0025E6EB1A|nr:hypothetical protein [uncultured Fibrobacter sp.]
MFGHYRGAAAALGIAAMGSALGCGTAGMSAITMWKKAYAQGKSAAVACDALGETGKGMVNYPVSQKRLGVSESCWREDQQQGQFFNVHLAGPVAWGARYRGNRGPVRSRVLHDAGIVG